MYDIKQMINGQWSLVFDEILNEGAYHQLIELDIYYTDQPKNHIHWCDFSFDNTDSKLYSERNKPDYMDASVYDVGFSGHN